MSLRSRLNDAHAYKSMAMLGKHAFGPPCKDCGKPKSSYMLTAHREISERRLGKRMFACQGVCHCADELAWEREHTGAAA